MKKDDGRAGTRVFRCIMEQESGTMQRVAKVKALENYLLLLQFQNGEKRLFDCQPLLNDRLYEKLKDADFFHSVHVDNMGVVCWDEATDINPYVLYEKSESVVGFEF